jgi:hydrogenase expression/formation protein HypE
MKFHAIIKSDSAPIYGLVRKALCVSNKIRFMRDPTRGGIATTLNEIALGAEVGIMVEEAEVPVGESVRHACELLGFDPLYLACEGRVIIITAKESEHKVLNAIRSDKAGRGAKIIGFITKDHPCEVHLRTMAGGRRLVDMLSGEQLPRIC